MGLIAAFFVSYLLIGYVAAIVIAYWEGRTQEDPISFQPSRILLQVTCWALIVLWASWKMACVPVAIARQMGIRIRRSVQAQGETQWVRQR